MRPQTQNSVESTDLKDIDVSYLERIATQEEAAEDVDPAALRKLKWKIDLFILPLISSVYFFSSMGRSDLANAKIAGITIDLKLTPKDYSNAASTFLIGYIVFQLPGTLLIRQIRANIQFAGAMTIV